jgi:hypothetical protein
MSTPPSPAPSPVYSIASILSLVCAIMSFTSGAILGLILAVLAILFGSFGALTSLSPHRRGGLMSTFAMFAGVIGIVAALIKAILWIL